MQPNIAMKFAEYVTGILLCKRCKFARKNYYYSRDVDFLPTWLLFGTPCSLANSNSKNVHQRDTDARLTKFTRKHPWSLQLHWNKLSERQGRHFSLDKGYV